MADWKKIGKKVGKAANKAIHKTEEIADITVKHVKLASCEAKINKLYEKLGRLTYKQLKSGESQAEKISEVILSIDRGRAEYAEKRKALEEDKKRREEAKKQNECEKVKIEVVVPGEHIEEDDDEE